MHTEQQYPHTHAHTHTHTHARTHTHTHTVLRVAEVWTCRGGESGHQRGMFDVMYRDGEHQVLWVDTAECNATAFIKQFWFALLVLTG